MRLNSANPPIHLEVERVMLPQILNEELHLLFQRFVSGLRGPEIVATICQELPGGDLVDGGVGSVERFTVDGKFDEAGSLDGGRVMLEPDVLGDLNERRDVLIVELGNLGDDALEGLPEISTSEGEIYDGTLEWHNSEEVFAGDISWIDRGAVSTGVGDGGVGVVSTEPLHGIGDDVSNVAFTFLAMGVVEENVGFSNGLLQEPAERYGPLANLSLEFRVNGGDVGHVDWSTSQLDNATIVVKARVKSTEVFTPLICSDHKHCLALQIRHSSWVGTFRIGNVSKWSVGVTTNDEVKTLGVPGKFLVFLVANVSNSHDALGQLPAVDEVDGFLHHLGGVEELGSRARAGDTGSGLCDDTDNSKIVLLEDLEGLDVFHEIGVGAAYVGAYSGESQIIQLRLRVGLDV